MHVEGGFVDRLKRHVMTGIDVSLCLVAQDLVGRYEPPTSIPLEEPHKYPFTFNLTAPQRHAFLRRLT